MKKIIIATTVPQSLNDFWQGVLFELSQIYEVIGLSSPGFDLEEVATRERVRVIAIPIERHISIGRDLKSLWLIWRVFRKEKPMMVHSMTPKAGLLCMVAAWIARVPLRVHTFTGLVFPTSSGILRKILMTTDWLTCTCATHVIPEGNGVKNDLLNNGITNKSMKVLGYGNVKGVDLSFYSRRKEVIDKMNELNLRKHDMLTFLFVGRIVRDKGINELVAAFEKLNKECTNVRLIMVGPYEDSLDPIGEDSRIIIQKNKNIEAVGGKIGDELLAYYAAADCYIHPSYREGFPNTVLEAGAMGLPSIVTDINGSREIIVEGVNGVIVPSKNADALYEAMVNMIKDKSARERMASNARQMIADRFEQSFVRKCLYDFYEDLLAPYK